MNAQTLIPSQHLKAADFAQPRLLTISKVGMVEVGDDKKPALFFVETDQDVVLNKTNITTISEIYGDETDNWAGKKIVAFKARTEFQGKACDCIRVRAPKTATNMPTNTPPPPPPADLGIREEDVPF